jgi:hypothetical protein
MLKKYKYEDIELGVVLAIATTVFVYCVTRITLQEIFQIYW